MFFQHYYARACPGFSAGVQMSQTSSIRAARPGRTMYVGEERCERIRRCAVEASYHSGQTISGSQFLQFLIDNFSDPAVSTLIKEIGKNVK